MRTNVGVARWLGLAVLAAGSGTLPLTAQPVDDVDLEISVVTFGPGPLSWERFGHNAIWVRQPSRQLDVLFNYGIFDPNRGDFLPRFIRGRMLYMMAGQSTRAIDAYIRADRSVWVQDLNLTRAQRVQLRDFLIDNARPENRDYRYHYYYDNCSTRVRDAIDRVLGGAFRRQFEAAPSGTTFRFHTQRLTVDDVPLYTGLLLGLGNPVDRPISEWEEMFLPRSVMENLRELTVVDEAGNTVPLVRSERTLHRDPRYDGAAAPPAWAWAYLLAGAVVAAAMVLVAKRSRAGFLVLGTLWSLLIGTGGAVLTFLWTMTDHNTSYWNENLFVLNPLALVLVVLLPLVRDPTGRAARWSAAVAAVVVGLAMIGFVAQVLPGFDQVNGQAIALFLPPSLALGYGVRLVTHAPVSTA